MPNTEEVNNKQRGECLRKINGMPLPVGKYKVGDVDCEVKVSDHETYVVVYSTVAGSDTPIPGSQANIPKEIVK